MNIVAAILSFIKDIIIGVFTDAMKTPAETEDVQYEDTDIPHLPDEYYNDKYGL